MRTALRLAAATTAILLAVFQAAHVLDKAGAMTHFASVERPALVDVLPGSFAYRLSGEFSIAGRPARAPLVQYKLEGVLEMMSHQVTVAEYERCVAAGACEKLAAQRASEGSNFPAVQVSWQDATDYAAWLSANTGENYRLPTDEEWAYAAGSRFRDDASSQADDPSDPSKAWLSKYERESEGTDRFDSRVRPVGSFGANEKGLLRSLGKCLGVDEHLLRAPNRRPGRSSVDCRKLRRSRRGGPAPRLRFRLHPRCTCRRLRGRHAPEQSRLSAFARKGGEDSFC